MTTWTRAIVGPVLFSATAAAGSGPGDAPDGMLIVLNKSQASASLLDRSSGKVIAHLPTGTGPHEVAVSPDGRTAVVCNYGDRSPGSTLTVIDLRGPRVVRTIDLGEYQRPHGIVFLRDGQRVVVTSEAKQSLLIVDVRVGRVLHAIDTGQKISHMVAVAPDERRAFVANIGSGSISVIDLEQGRRVAVVETGAGAEGIDVSPDGRQVWVANRSADTVSVVDAGSLDVLASLACPSFPIRVKFTPDGRHVLVSNARTGDVAVFDAAQRKLVRRIEMKVGAVQSKDERLFGRTFGESPVPVGILIPPDGRHAYVANTNADVVTVIDLRTWRVVDRLTAGKEPDGMAFTPLRASAAEPESD